MDSRLHHHPHQGAHRFGQHRHPLQTRTMNYKNTSLAEDRVIDSASEAVSGMASIIERLDDLIEEWKEVSGCDSPAELRKKLEELK
jgi:hypothetical protein